MALLCQQCTYWREDGSKAEEYRLVPQCMGPSVRKEEGDDQVGARNFRVWVMKAQFMPGARLGREHFARLVVGNPSSANIELRLS